MFARLFSSHSRHFRHLSTTTLSPHFHPPFLSPQTPKFHSTTHFISRNFSTNHNGNNNNNNNNNNNGEKPTSDLWKMGQEDTNLDNIFDTHDLNLKGISQDVEKDSQQQSWAIAGTVREGDGGLFEEFGGGFGDGSVPMPGFEPWKLGEEERLEDLFGIEDSGVGEDVTEKEREMVSAAQRLELEKEESALMDVLKGPNRAFGDLVAQSGITDEMLDSLIALKNFQDIEGLPPLSQIEEERHEKTTRKSSRYEMELQKQEEAAKARVRQVDEKGRAYGTGKRKCSIARVWIQPGEGKFLVNDKEYDVYFPMLDHRAAVLRPFSETKTLGLWDVKCTVKGGGVTGQVDAIRLGISRALQNWEPGLRPPLREAGFLTRDPRVVERKKPGKAKARKSFQWVKR